MNRIVRNRIVAALLLGMGVCVGLAPAFVQATEVTVKNDSIVEGSTATICPCFVAGESAAAWLTSPCNGDIVAVQVFWRSLLGGAPQSLEDSITIFAQGTFPTPGVVLETLEGPVLTDGVLNEYRYLDENQTIPLIVPVTSGQVFVVSLKFFNDSPQFGPSIVFDNDGCRNGRNTVDAQGQGWTNACDLGVSGDWMIRAIVDCADPTGACCFPDGSCLDDETAADCANSGGTYQGNGTDCLSVSCPVLLGACCDVDGMCTDGLSESTCLATGGTFQGPDTTCATDPCPEPTGACCIGGSCLGNTTESTCSGAGGTYAGNGTTCPAACAPGACCFTDGSCVELAEVQCDNAGGTFSGAGTSCTPNNCPQPTGACCFGEFCFPNQPEADCLNLDPPGVWQGADTSCTPNPCLGGCASTAVCPDADVNCDNVVTGLDIAIIKSSANFGKAVGDAAEPRADVNGDGLITGLDVAEASSSACFGQ